MTILRVERLTKTFGGVHAIEALDFIIERNKIHAVIGPNGAGKTTLFNLISGLYIPSSGYIYLNDEDIAAKQPHELAQRGLSRTFQNLQICMNMSAMENVMIGRHLHLDVRFVSAMFRLPGMVKGDRICRDEAAELMESVGIGSYTSAKADAMPYGALKRLEIARALAAKPKLLLLDEPAAGLNPKETAEIIELIHSIAESGITVVLVEHDMKLVMGVADDILVLDYGKELARGSAAEVRNNPEVIAAYLGGAERRPDEP